MNNRTKSALSKSQCQHFILTNSICDKCGKKVQFQSDKIKQPDCDFIDYCGDKAIGQVRYGSEVKNVCLYHAQELCEDADEDGGIDDTLEMFV